MSHLDNKPEDTKDIKAAKAIVQGKAEACPQEIVRLLMACLDDRSNFVAKLAESSDSMIDVAAAFQAHTELQQESLDWQRGLIREIGAMLEPDDSAPETSRNYIRDYVVDPVIELMEGDHK